MFDLEIEDGDAARPTPRLPLELQRLVSSNGRAQAKLWMHALKSREALSSDPSSSVDVHAFAQTLADVGHTVWLRNGTYVCPAELGLSTIRHSFVVAALPGDVHNGQPIYCVLDPNWQEHFRLAGAGSEEYNQLLALLPSVFVGCADQLAALVTLLCKEMEKVFHARGVSLPPWRSPRVMQGRWLVNQANDIHVPPTNSTNHQANSAHQQATIARSHSAKAHPLNDEDVAQALVEVN